VSAHRGRPGVVSRQGVVQTITWQVSDKPPVHTIQCRCRVDGVNGIPDISHAITVTINSILFPGRGQELRNTQGAGRGNCLNIPTAFRRDLCSQHFDGHSRTSFRGLLDDCAVRSRDDLWPDDAAGLNGLAHPFADGDHRHGEARDHQAEHDQLAHRNTVTRGAYRGRMTDPQVPKISAPADVERLLETSLAEAFDALGCFNLAIFGKTGSGKSTLVNAIFGREVAATGLGNPVTKGLKYHRHEDGFLGLFDSEGFETGTSGDAILAGMATLVRQQADKPIDERIHAVWYVVRWADRRFEPTQAAFVRVLHDLGLPVVVVLTQVPTRDGQPHPDAVALAEHIESLDLPLAPDGHVVLTNAMPDEFTGSPVVGLQPLLDATYRVAPAASQQALTAAQVLDVQRKKKAAAGIVRQSAAAAAVVGATPIPFADAALLIPTQVTMIARITAAFGLPRHTSRALALVGSIALTGGATLAGRSLASSLMKFVPGGAVVGSAISGTVAAALTTTVGTAWSRVCEYTLSLPPSERDAFLRSDDAVQRFQSLVRGAGSLSAKSRK